MSCRGAEGWHVRLAGPPSLAVLLLALTATAVPDRTVFVANETTRIEVAGEQGRWTGARISSGDRLVAVVEFTSGARWTASRVASNNGKRSASLTFRDFDTAGTGGTPQLAPSSFVRFTLARGAERFSRVDFRFEMVSFDEQAWQAAWSGAWPLHFLCCAAREPEYYYYGGWLAGPSADESSGSRSGRAEMPWVGDWSEMAGIGSLGIPAAGLWRPSAESLVVYSFQHTRHTDKSRKDIVIAHRGGADVSPGECVALIWPSDADSGDAAYPSAPGAVEGHFDLLYDLESGSTRHPSDVVFRHTWSHYRDLLPTVPRMNDLGWMVERHRLPEASGAPGVACPVSGGLPDGDGSAAMGLPESVDPPLVWQQARMFVDDADGGDVFDPTFLMLPLGAPPQADQVDWAALGDLIRGMIVAYVETGDARLEYCVRGALDRWPGGLDSDGYHMVVPTRVAAPASPGEWCLSEEGPLDSFWEWAQPLGEAVLHVTAGERAAIAFCRGTTSLDVSDYRFRPRANFAFAIAGEHDGPFPMIFSSPHGDLSRVVVRVDGVEYGEDALERSGKHLRFVAHAGDAVEIGDPGDAEVREREPVPTHPASIAGLAGVPRGLECLDLASECNTKLDLSWEKRDSWAGLRAGRAFAHGVPYALPDPTAGEGKVAARKTMVSVSRRAAGLFLVSSKLTEKDLVVVLTTGPLPPIHPDEGLPIRTGRPLRDWELWLYPVVLSDHAEVEAIWAPSSAHLFAVTIERRGGRLVREVKQLIEGRREHDMAARAAARVRDEVVLACRKRVRRQLDRKIIRAALLPPHGPETIKLKRALYELGIRSTALRPDEVAEPSLLTPHRYPVLVSPWPDVHLPSDSRPGDFEAPILRYLQQRGTLLALGRCGASVEDTEWTRFGRRVGLDLLAPGERRDDSVGLSALPEGELTLRREKGQDLVCHLPDAVPFPSLPDCAFTPVVSHRLSPEDEFIPVLALYDADRGRHGAAMGVVRRRLPEFAGANLIWVWGGLASDAFAYADTVLFEALATAAELCESGAPEAARPGGEPYAPAVGVLPLAESGRAHLVKLVCAEMNLGCVDVAEDVFVEPLTFNPSRFPIAVHAAPKGEFLASWRLPHDGTDAYLRYVRAGGFLIVCGGGPPFRCAVQHVGDEWQGERVLRPALARELRLPVQSEIALPTGDLLLKAAAGDRLFPGAWKPVDLTSVAARCWCCLAQVRGADVEWTPLAWLTGSGAPRYDGYAAAMMRLRGPAGRTGGILYVWGELIEDERGGEFMRAALRCAMNEVQELPSG